MRQGTQIYWPPFSKTIKNIVIITVICFLAQQILPLFLNFPFTAILGLSPILFIEKFFIWQIVTYMFLHGGILHLLFNMFAFWMFGGELEKYWGAKRFIVFYFLAGAFSGLLSVLTYYSPQTSIIGASGGIYALLVAYGFMFPNRHLLFFGIFPMKTKYFIMLICAITFFVTLSSVQNVAHFAHIGGIIFGFLFMKFGQWKNLLTSFGKIRKQVKRDKLKSRFKVITDEMTNTEIDKFWKNHSDDHNSWN